MYGVNGVITHNTDLSAFARNRYFYGKLLDVHHFEMEQHYFRGKTALLNRLIPGFGVVCGLGVELTDDEHIVVQPGVAIDKWGRVIVVPKPSVPYRLPRDEPPEPAPTLQRHQECDPELYGHIRLCYHECETHPTPVMASDCESIDRCLPGAIEERYCIDFKAGAAKEHAINTNLHKFLCSEHSLHKALACYVSKCCRPLPDDPCIPLANVRLRNPDEGYRAKDIDITVRPIVYTNELLFELILAFKSDSRHPRGATY